MSDPVAAARVPWIGAQWDLIDLQVEQRTGRVSSSLFAGGRLVLRQNDNFRLAVLFFDGTGTAVNPAPSRLRWTLRDAANLELLDNVTVNNPTAATDQADPYFLLQPNIARMGGAALDLLAEGTPALDCVADLDWTIAGKTYSADTFPVSFGFGLSAKDTSAPSAPAQPTTPSTPVNPTTPSTQPPTTTPTTPGLTAEDVARLFETLWSAKFPPGEGFVYVRNGDVETLVPGGDCTTGQTWNPT